MELLSRLASAGMGIAFVPETFTRPEYQLDYYSIGPEGHFRSLAIGYANGYRSKAVIKFSEMVKETLCNKQQEFRQAHNAL